MTDRIKNLTSAEQYVWGENCTSRILSDNDLLSLKQEKMPVGTSEVLHYHKIAHQVFYILSGTATFEIDGHSFNVTQLHSITILPNEKHKISNSGDCELEFLVISSPGTKDDRVNIENES